MKLPEWGSGIGKHILKLADGASIPGVFRGEMVRFYQHWANNQSSICPGRETCALCKQGEKGTGRFRINFLTQENGQWVAKIFEAGRKVFDQMVALNADCPLEKMKVKIIRNGTGKNATTTVAGFVGEQALVQPELEKILVQVPLHDLQAALKHSDEEEASGDIPF